MATDPDTITFLLEQMAGAGNITSRRMFGEYALYCDGKVVAFVCDDQLFLKPTPEGRALLGTPTEAPAYPGSKMYYLIETELDEPDALARLIATTAAALPEPKPKAPRKPKR